MGEISSYHPAGNHYIPPKPKLPKEEQEAAEPNSQPEKNELDQVKNREEQIENSKEE